MTTRSRLYLALAITLVASAPLAAQLPSASPAAHAMAGNFTALARGYEAIAWNPANLGMPGRPGFSLGVGVVGGSFGLDPVDLRTMNKWGGIVVPAEERRAWVEDARAAGGQHTRLDGGVTPIAFTIGPFGVQGGVSTYMNMTLSPDAWEAMLFGNAGNSANQQPKTLDLSGTRIRAGVIGSGATSLAIPIPINLTQGALPDERAAIGVTAKYVAAYGLLLGDNVGSVLGEDDVVIQFPLITNRDTVLSADPIGTGFGADLSVAWRGGPWRVGLLAENVFNSFKYDTERLALIDGEGYFAADSNNFDFDTRLPFASAPAALREAVTNQKFAPAFTLGGAFQVMRSLTLTGDFRTSLGGDDAIHIGPKSRLGFGAEWRMLSFLPIRAGVASVTDGWQAGAGVGLRLLGYEIGASTSIRRRGPASESGFMLGIVGIGR